MSDYAGDYPANHTCVQLPFNTYGDSSASPYDLPGFTSADVKIYKNGTETPRSSANGVTAHTTFNDIVGNNMVLIDLSDNTDARWKFFDSRAARYTAGFISEPICRSACSALLNPV